MTIKSQGNKNSRLYSTLTEAQKERKRASARAYQARNRDKVRLAKRAYDQTEAGKESKRRCEEAYKATGGRKAAEARRAARGISEARLAAKKLHAAKRRVSGQELQELDTFVLREAYRLAKLRQQYLGTRWDVDHIIPVSKGGTNKADNIQVVPALWNKQKSNKHQDRFFGAFKGETR